MTEPAQPPPTKTTTREEHRQRHVELHRAFDELLADYMRHHPHELRFLEMPVERLLKWSHEQTIEPAELEPPKPPVRPDR